MDKIIRIVGIIVSALLFIYLPLDSGGFNLRAMTFAVIMIFPLMAVIILFLKEGRYPGKIKAAAFFFLGFVLISTLLSTDRYLSLKEFYLLLAGFGAFVIGFALAGDRKVFKKALLFLQGIGLFNAMAGILLYLLPGNESARVTGFFFQPDILAGFLLLFIPSALELFLGEENPKLFVYTGFSSVIMLTALFLTRSRGAMIALTLVIMILFFTMFKSKRLQKAGPKLAYVAGLVLFFTFLMKPGGILKQAGTPSSPKEETSRIEIPVEEADGTGAVKKSNPESIRARLDFWEGALRIALERPLTGTGLGTYQYHYPRYQKRVKFYSKYVHNYYLSILSGAGFPAFISFMTLLALFLFHFYGKFQSKPDPSDREGAFYASCRTGAALGLLGLLFHAFVDVDFSFTSITFSFWFIAGLLTGFDAESGGEKYNDKPAFRILRMVLALCLILLMFPIFFAFISERSLEEGKQADEQKRFQLSEQLYKRAYSANPVSSETCRKLASFYYIHKKYDLSLFWIDRALALSPWRARLYMDKGRILMEGGRGELAPPMFVRTIELDPYNQIRAYNALAEYYVLKGDNDKALEILKKVDSIYGKLDLDDIWHFRAEVLKPQLAKAYMALGTVSLNKKDVDTAVAAYSKAVTYMKNQHTLFAYGFALFQKKEWQKSLDALLEAASIDGSIKGIDYYISQCYKNLGNREKALEYIEKFNKSREKN